MTAPPPSDAWSTTWRATIVRLLAPPPPPPPPPPDHAYIRGRWDEIHIAD